MVCFNNILPVLFEQMLQSVSCAISVRTLKYSCPSIVIYFCASSVNLEHNNLVSFGGLIYLLNLKVSLYYVLCGCSKLCPSVRDILHG